MNVGIVVEGADDCEVYPVLLKRIRPEIDRVHHRECGGRYKLAHKFVVFLKEFAKNPAAFGVERVFVIRDSDCQDPARIEEELQSTLQTSRLALRFEVLFHATKCKLESWLLADEHAVNTTSLRRGGCGGAAAIRENLEEFRDSDLLYRRTLRSIGLQDTPRVMGEIAALADLDRIAARCPHFRAFADKVRGL